MENDANGRESCCTLRSQCNRSQQGAPPPPPQPIVTPPAPNLVTSSSPIDNDSVQKVGGDAIPFVLSAVNARRARNRYGRYWNRTPATT
jgi:hypothetical protein